MGTYRKFVYWLLASCILFICLNFLVWKGYTEKILGPGVGGDLARLGYIPWVKTPREIVNDLSKQHIEQEEYSGQPIDVLTFGDSFSNGGGGGRNRYYQDYLATINNFEVLNIEPFKDPDFLTTIVVMCNNGYLETIHPKYLLLSSSVTQCIQRFAQPIDLSKNMSMEELLRHKKMGFNGTSKPNAAVAAKGLSFVNDGNYKLLLYSILYRFSNRAYFSKVYQVNLNKPFFSNGYPTKLLFYKEDLATIPFTQKGTVEKVNENLNQVSDLLMKKGIKLYFMPCVDKYDLYRDYIDDNKYPKSVFFEELRKLPKSYVLIDTKAILAEELRKGEKDIFHADDTHWTWKASKKIFETVRFQ